MVRLVSKLVALVSVGRCPATPDAARQNLDGWDVKGVRVVLTVGGPVTTPVCRSWAFESKGDPTYSGFRIVCRRLFVLYTVHHPTS